MDNEARESPKCHLSHRSRLSHPVKVRLRIDDITLGRAHPLCVSVALWLNADPAHRGLGSVAHTCAIAAWPRVASRNFRQPRLLRPDVREARAGPGGQQQIADPLVPARLAGTYEGRRPFASRVFTCVTMLMN